MLVEYTKKRQTISKYVQKAWKNREKNTQMHIIILKTVNSYKTLKF